MGKKERKKETLTKSELLLLVASVLRSASCRIYEKAGNLRLEDIEKMARKGTASLLNALLFISKRANLYCTLWVQMERKELYIHNNEGRSADYTYALHVASKREGHD